MFWLRSTTGSRRNLQQLYTCRHNSSSASRQLAHEPFNILFFGRDEFSCAVFRELHAAQDVWQGLQAVTQPDERVGRNGSQVSISPLKTLSHTLNVPVHEIPQQRQAFRTWKPSHPFNGSTSDTAPESSHLLITASFGRIISSPLLNRFHPQRRLNVHPSLLPLYRGPAPLQRALIDGCEDTGVSIIGMTRYVKGQAGGVDLGDVWAQEKHTIETGTSFTTLREHLAQNGGRLLVQVLRDMLQGAAHRRSQESLGYSEPYPYAHFITPNDYRIQWHEQDANQIVRTFNAIGHQHSLTTWLPDGTTSLQLHSPAVVTESDKTFAHISRPGQGFFHKPSGAVLIRCARKTLLAVKTLKQERMKMVPAKDFWNGVRGRPAWLGEIENDGRKWQYIQFCEPPTQACQT